MKTTYSKIYIQDNWWEDNDFKLLSALMWVVRLATVVFIALCTWYVVWLCNQ